MTLKRRSQNYLNNKKNCAHSIIEIIVAITIAIFSLTIVIPKFKIFERLILNNEVENLFLTIMFLHQKSIATNKIETLFFVPEKNLYFYKTKKSRIIHELSSNIKFGFMKNSKGPPSSKKNFIKNAITFAHNKIIFYPNGQISPGTAYLVNNRKTLMQAVTTPISQISFIRKY